MRFRKLRIAWSVGWGMVALLFVVLWILSLIAEDRISGRISTYFFRVYSSRGCLVVYLPTEPRPINVHPWGASFRSEYWLQKSDSRIAFVPRFVRRSLEMWVTLPYWFLVAIYSSVAAAVWIPRRFTLRTLLIATTLFAVALGLIVWLHK